MYEVTKKFPDIGSPCFRNHRAESHCHFLHGHNLSFEVTWASPFVDDRSWVIDFGDLKGLRHDLEAMFDHTVVVAFDDPALPQFKALETAGAADITVVQSVSCEAFARMAFDIAEERTQTLKTSGKVRDDVFVLKVVCHEDHKNSATYVRT